MPTDITLNENDVTVAAAVLKVQGADLLIDDAARRHNGSPYRRALVHDFDDRLTINFDGDYPSGVRVTGDTLIDGELAARSLRLEPPEGTLWVDGLLKMFQDVIPSPGKISAGSIEFLMDDLLGPVLDPEAAAPTGPMKKMVDLAETVRDLTDQIADLYRRIAELEK